MIWHELFKARRDAPWIGYLPVLIVAAFFALYGLHEGIFDALPYTLLTAVVALQLRYRTLAGWGLLFSLCIIYSVMVLATPQNGNLQDYVFFAACGLVPAALLIISYPRRTKT